MSRKTVAAAFVVAAVSVAVAVSVSTAGTTKTAGPAKNCAFTLRIGDVLPFTGGLAAYGANLDRAVKPAVDLQNAALKQAGLTGRSVEMVGSEDGQTQAGASVEAATKLVKSNHANVIIGEMASSATIPMAQSVTIPNHVVQISPTSSAPQIATSRTTATSGGPIPRTPCRARCSRRRSSRVRQGRNDQRRSPQRRIRDGAETAVHRRVQEAAAARSGVNTRGIPTSPTSTARWGSSSAVTRRAG